MARHGADAVLAFYGHRDDKEQFRRKLDGIRRFARGAGWRVAAIPPMGQVTLRSPLPPRVVSASPPLDEDALRGALSRLAPVGVVVDCSIPENLPPARAFAGWPVVWLDISEPLRRSGGIVRCDNTAIAAAAFRELAATRPSAFAVSPYHFRRRWSDERVAAFLALCRAEGKKCHVFQQRFADDIEERRPRRAAWAASLPDRVAVFAVNDFEARETARAFADVHRPVPRAATIVGVDGFDAIPDDEYVPAATLSSVKIDYEQTGYLAARMLWDFLDGKKPPDVALYGPMFVERRQSTRGYGRRAPFVLEAVEAIRREAEKPDFTAWTLAARFRCSRNLCERRFREAMGCSVLEEIMRVRLEKVYALLMRRDVTIGAIAGLCGFGSESELRAIFRSRAHCSLRQWRKEHAH